MAIVLDLEGTDDRIHGHQAGRFDYGYLRQLLLFAAYEIGALASVCSTACVLGLRERRDMQKFVSRIDPSMMIETAIVEATRISPASLSRGRSSFQTSAASPRCLPELQSPEVDDSDVAHQVVSAFRHRRLAKNNRLKGEIVEQMTSGRQPSLTIFDRRTDMGAQRDFRCRTSEIQLELRAGCVINKAKSLEKGAKPRGRRGYPHGRPNVIMGSIAQLYDRLLLCTGRHGKSDQGTVTWMYSPTGPVRRTPRAHEILLYLDSTFLRAHARPGRRLSTSTRSP